LKVLFTIGSLDLGGTESQMVLLILELKKRGFHCEVFALADQGPLHRDLEAHRVVVLNGGYDPNVAFLLKVLQLSRALFRLIALSFRMKPDVIHAYLPLTNFLGALAGRMTGVDKIITSRRALGTHQDRHRLWKPFDQIANLLSDCVTANSHAVANDTVVRDGADRKKLAIIPNGIDCKRFDVAVKKREVMRQALGLKAGEFGVIMVGNLIPYKGHADFLQALPYIVKTVSNLRLFLVGEDRGVWKILKGMANDLGVADYVIYLGCRDDVAEVLAAMDIFVMPSHEEGFSNALLEAMASGLAIVATDVGGNREALENGNLGILLPPRNPVGLADAVRYLLTNKDFCLQLGLRAKQTVKTKYAVAAMVNAHIALYH